MADQNLLLSSDLNLNLLSKSSPSQLQPFQFNRSRTQPLPTEAFYVSSQKNINNNNNNLKPSNLSHVPCKFYKQGTCTAGANCTFSHSSDLSSESAVCKYFVKGNCKFGTKCALLHTMSPYGSNSNSNGKNRNIPITNQPLTQLQQQQQQQQNNNNNNRRKINDQMINNSLDHRSFLNDPFGSSAPAVSLFHTNTGDQLWRNQQQRTTSTSMISNDFIGLRSSPRESSDHLLGSYRQQALSSSLRSNGGYFNSIPVENNNRRQQNYLNSGPMIDDLNDAMLPSSLNDLFTPNELHARSLRQQENISFDTWRVPFFKQDEGTAAINIPNGNNNSMSSSSNGSYLQQQQQQTNEDFHDDEVQFYMEDDEAVTYDHLNNKNYSFPSLISLPST